MKKINYTLDINQTIIAWRITPFNENEPYIEVSDDTIINTGFDKIVDGQLQKDTEGYETYYSAQKNKITKCNRIIELKTFLASTDYQAIKYAEGELSAEEYAPVKEQRRAARAEINQLEAELANL